MKLTCHLPNPGDAETNQRVYKALADAIAAGETFVRLSVPLNESGDLVYMATAQLVAIEGDNFEPEPADPVAEREAHERADELAHRHLSGIRRAPREKPMAYQGRLERERRLFRESHPEWQPEKFDQPPDAA
jgi:hypothetical protein